MLSFIYQLVQHFENSHGIRPNLLYLNQTHLHHLQDGFSDEYDLYQITRLLEMEIIIDAETVHPRVAWTHLIGTKTATC